MHWTFQFLLRFRSSPCVSTNWRSSTDRSRFHFTGQLRNHRDRPPGSFSPTQTVPRCSQVPSIVTSPARAVCILLVGGKESTDADP